MDLNKTKQRLLSEVDSFSIQLAQLEANKATIMTEMVKRQGQLELIEMLLAEQSRLDDE